MSDARFRAGKRLWNAKDDERMRREYPNAPTSELARSLGRSANAVYARADLLGLVKSAAYLASPHACRLRRGDNVGAAYRFKPGQTPANEGLRRPGYGPGRMKETQFKKGQLNGVAARRHMPVGSTGLCDGYVYRKISDTRNVPWTRNWKLEHLIIWEAVHGPVPASHALAFKNGDRADIRLDNLELITRRELMARNSVHNLPKPIATTVQLLGALHRQIRRKACGEEQDHGPAQSSVRDARSVEGRGKADGHRPREGGRGRGQSHHRVGEGGSGVSPHHGRGVCD